jgi:hypothetical protein
MRRKKHIRVPGPQQYRSAVHVLGLDFPLYLIDLTSASFEQNMKKMFPHPPSFAMSN